MRIEQVLAEISPEKDMLLTLGVFDGVHLGHKYLLSQLIEQAQQKQLLSGVVTFRQHPRAVLAPQTRLPFLTSINQRVNLIKGEGIDTVVTLPFTHDVARISARDFIGLLKEHLRMQGLVIGYDFALGQDREGDGSSLSTMGQEMGFTVTVVPPAIINGEVASSTSIRNALAKGDMNRVRRLLGRSFGLHGYVTTGVGRGTELGFPTANLEVDSQQALPPDGVYVTLAYINHEPHPSMTNIGQRPTFGSDGRTIEVYLLDYNDDLYEKEMSIDIVERLRDERRFETAEELKKQIAVDIEQGRAILASQDAD